MSIGPLLLAIASALLIVGGLYITLRDVRGKKPAPPVRTATAAPPPPPTPPAMPRPRSDAPPPVSPVTTPVTGPPRFSETNADVTIVKRSADPRTQPAARTQPARPALTATAATPASGSAFAELQTAVAAIATEGMADTADTTPEGQRWPSVESRWFSIEPQIERAVGQLNAVLVPVAMTIGPAGEAGWSFKNRGYGSYRRVSIGGRSIAWLRADTNPENVLSFKVRAHAVDHALINATVVQDVGNLNDHGMLEALSKAVRSAAEYAAWAVPKQRVEAEVSQDTWSEISPLVREAFSVAVAALREADAELIEIGKPSLETATGQHRWPLAVRVSGREVARVTVDLVKRSLEIGSQSNNPGRPDLSRRRRLDLAGLTAHALAEAIAACAWPAVADALEQPADTERIR